MTEQRVTMPDPVDYQSQEMQIDTECAFAGQTG